MTLGDVIGVAIIAAPVLPFVIASMVRDRYRIRVNSNGLYRVERRMGAFFTRQWKDKGALGIGGYWETGGDGSSYQSSEEAVAALLLGQERDADEKRDNQWTTVASVKE